MTRCCICAAPARARVFLKVRIQPVWSLAAEDQGESDIELGFCGEHTASMDNGNDHLADTFVEFVPASVRELAR